MSELVSSTAIAQALSQHNDDPFVVLLTLTHETLATPIYIARNRENLVSRGNTYLAYPFQISLPSDNDNAPQAQITVANVSRLIGQALERCVYPPNCLMEIVLASTPDTVERSWDEFSFTQATWDAFRVTATLEQLGYWDEPFPGVFMTPQDFPGMFP